MIKGILIFIFIVIFIICCYYYFLDPGHKILFNSHDLFYGNKVVYIGPESMPLSTEGIQYTFSIWLRTNNIYLNSEWSTASDTPKTIIDNNGSPNIVYLVNKNILRIQMGYYGKNNTLEFYNIDLKDFEFQKWVNIVITVDNNHVNIFKDGYLETSTKLLNPNLKNFKMMSIGEKHNNFNGYIGKIDYYNYILKPNKILSLYEKYLYHHPSKLMSYEDYEHLRKEEEDSEIKLDKFNNFFV
jgi:hypothetical protein